MWCYIYYNTSYSVNSWSTFFAYFFLFSLNSVDIMPRRGRRSSRESIVEREEEEGGVEGKGDALTGRKEVPLEEEEEEEASSTSVPLQRLTRAQLRLQRNFSTKKTPSDVLKEEEEEERDHSFPSPNYPNPSFSSSSLPANPSVAIMGITECAICGGSEDEERILLCDGNNCSNEIHMSCLNPEIKEVPEGEWFCPECDDHSTLNILLNVLLNIQSQRIDFCVTQNAKFNEWISHYILNSRPLHLWNPLSNPSSIPASELSSFLYSSACIGCVLKTVIDRREYAGRILHYRYDEDFECFEHLIQFKSSSSDLNKPLITWLCIEELDCVVGREVLWIKLNALSPWWPSQRFYRSSLHLLNHFSSSSSSSSAAGACYSIFEENTMYTTSSEPSNSPLTLPFVGPSSRVKEFRSSKKLNIAFSLASIELEEQEATCRAFRSLSIEQLETFGGLGDGFKLKHLKARTSQDKAKSGMSLSKPSVVIGQYDIKHAYNTSSATHDISARYLFIIS